jgi:hypothetical protein
MGANSMLMVEAVGTAPTSCIRSARFINEQDYLYYNSLLMYNAIFAC